MRAIRVASAALLGLGALTLCAPVILASDTGGGGRDGRQSFGFRVTPTTVAAGGRVSLHLDRGSGCRGAATVTSGLFDTVRIPSERDSVTATVDRTAQSQASYRVTIVCDGTSASTELAIASSTSAGHGDGHPDGTSAGDGRTDARGESDSSGNNNGNSNNSSSTDSRADSAAAGGTDSGGSDSRQALNPQPLPPGRGVQAGEGGSIDGFDLEEIGLGAALVVGSVGSAYRRSRRHADEDGA
ncbi:hypothetical protein ACFY6U_24495 [Streptomyces sp. NPDC013157]|uniref:hypothetical protein n=1 Tax=Streptomyces sp. NPDC013157 TaxID=3364861 RepID=UPI003686A9E3